MNEGFIGDNLRLMRLLHGLSQDELGSKVTSSRQYIQQLESGAKTPSTEFIAALTDALEVKHEFFFTNFANVIHEDQCHFRKRRTTKINTMKQVASYATIFNKLISLIDKKLNLPKVDFPQGEPKDHVEIERIAEHCRKHWRLGLDTPIKNMIRVVENAGAVVTRLNNNAPKIDALSVSSKRPIIILNNNYRENIARTRFDLAHECGHLVMHSGIETGDYKTEEEANRFASAFLLPRTAFVKEFPILPSRRINWKGIYQMKIRWKTSVSAIIRRASDLQLIDSMQYRRAYIFLSKSGQTKKEDHDDKIPQEEPELLNIAINKLAEGFKIDLQDICNKLYIKSTALQHFIDANPMPESDVNISYLSKYKFQKENL